MPWATAPILKVPNKIGPNEACWCGSGRKYKKCHREREKQKPIDIGTFSDTALAEFERKYCSHPSASPTTCNRIVKAHTITKSIALKTISENGHVYTSSNDQSRFSPVRRPLGPKKVGLKLASTFFGFCGKHDNELFEPIEKGEILFNDESMFLLAYRALAMELYKKEAELHAVKVARDIADRGRPVSQQILIQSELKERLHYTEIGTRETRTSKRKYDELLISRDFKNLKYIAIRFKDRLPIVSSGGRFPDFDFDGRPVFDIHEEYDDPPLVLLNIINDKNGAIATLAWLRDDPRLKAFAECFQRNLTERGADFLILLGISACENTFYQPSWWDSLDDSAKNTLSTAVLSDVDPEIPSWGNIIQTKIKSNVTLEIIGKVEKY